GDEAIAQGAIDAGLSGIYAYPGTPSTEITEYVQASKEARESGVHSEWSANEKTAMESALGMAYAGKRAMVCMKHVGLNVAADPFMNTAITGINGGLIVTVADDPSMHSSQNEQDSRFYGKFAHIPVLEPSNQQEAYEMVFYAFELSEKFKVPVMLRITTRLAHSRAGIVTMEKRPQNELKLPNDLKQFILLPAIARVRYNQLLNTQGSFAEASEDSGYNRLTEGRDHSLGIVACGLGYNYYMENARRYGLDYPVLKITQYPLPEKKIRKLADSVEKMMVIEEGYPFVEEMLRGFFNAPFIVNGRLDGHLPRVGELNPNVVAKALGKKEAYGADVPELVANRPPALCKGCSHADVYLAMNEAMEQYGKGRVFSDIGCYTLGALPPYNSINSCVDMGASVTMAKGAADAGLVPAVAVIGDSTFTHSGITGLLDAVIANSPVTVIISDNSTTGMTGGQTSAATGRLEKICTGIGVDPDHVLTLIPLKKNHQENVDIMARELEYQGVSVIIAQRECIQTAARKRKMAKAEH
ncbi:MAG TPA: thiamine pyrophosphate-dependent enzyme, partial [Bacteroidales bacterium]|nr:thiamine pyrophosphate-dependent enzyme [Bacteroidales bacterium]